MLSSNDKKPLWRFIKAKKQDNVNISSLKTPDGQIITDPASKANVLNQYFKTVFTVEDGKNQPHKGQSLYPAIANFEITTQGVYNILNTCNPYKSPGPDGIHPHALRETATEVSPMLTHIYQQSLSTGVLPTQWKHAYVTPIFKKGAKTDPTNYRPVSLTSVVCKSMEHILASQIMQHLSIHNILSDSQFGFRLKHSCESQLLVTVNDIARAINNNMQVDAAILDFSKAFDKVAHKHLIYKLDYYGIRGNLLNWLTSFLQNRSQEVVVEGINSTSCNITSGVPQGSVLGPVLFLMYINDIGLNIHSEIRLFADDILLYRPIRTPNDHLQLQEDLNTLTKWATDWKMAFNIPKCKIIQFTTHRNKSKYIYTMSKTPLEVVEEHGYLGVRLHHKLSWSPHVNHICNKANRLLGFLNRNLRHTPQNIKEYTYKQLVLPSIDYCSAIWDPYTKNDISKLEMLQHRAARFVMNKPWYRHQHNVSITKILAELHWPTLQNRRKQARLILMFKIVNGNLIVPTRCLPLPPTVTCTRANHSLKYAHLQSNMDVYRYSFLPRTIPQWNNLQIANIETLTLITFKEQLQAVTKLIIKCNYTLACYPNGFC